MSSKQGAKQAAVTGAVSAWQILCPGFRLSGCIQAALFIGVRCRGCMKQNGDTLRAETALTNLFFGSFFLPSLYLPSKTNMH